MKLSRYWRAGWIYVLPSAIVSISLAFTASAQSETNEQRLLRAEAQINSGGHDAALASLLSMQTSDDSFELRRLWAVAIAYVRSNRPRAALPFLEDLVSRKPNDATYRLELAATLQLLGQNDRAKYHYELSRGANLAAGIVQEIDRRIDIIDREKSWEAWIEFALAPESNPARKTTAETVTIDGLAFDLSEESRAQSAKGVDLGFGYTSMPRLSDDLRLRLGLNLDGRLYGGQAPDDLQVQGELGLLYFGDRDRRLSAGFTLAQRWYNGDGYSRTTGGYLSASQTVGESQRTRITGIARHERTRFDAFSNYASNTTFVSLQAERVLTPRWQVRVGVSAEQVVAPLPSESGDTSAWTLGSQYAFDGGLLVDVSISQSQSKRDGIDPLFGKLRTDQRQTLRSKMLHRRLNIGKFAPFVEFEFDRQKSTNEVFSYENTRIGLGLTARF